MADRACADIWSIMAHSTISYILQLKFWGYFSRESTFFPKNANSFPWNFGQIRILKSLKSWLQISGPNLLYGTPKRVLVGESSVIDCMPLALMKHWAERCATSVAISRTTSWGGKAMVVSWLHREVVTGSVPVTDGVFAFCDLSSLFSFTTHFKQTSCSNYHISG